MSEDLVSVIITCFNCDEMLDSCIESVINQYHKNLEIILINNGSDDNTAALCNKWYQNNQRIQVFHINHESDAKAKIFGLNHMKGDYYCFVNPGNDISKDYINSWLEELHFDTKTKAMYS